MSQVLRYITSNLLRTHRSEFNRLLCLPQITPLPPNRHTRSNRPFSTKKPKERISKEDLRKRRLVKLFETNDAESTRINSRVWNDIRGTGHDSESESDRDSDDPKAIKPGTITTVDLGHYSELMDHSLDNLRREFAGISTGRPSANMFEKLQVDNNGRATSISTLAQIVTTANVVTFNLFEESSSRAVKKYKLLDFKLCRVFDKFEYILDNSKTSTRRQNMESNYGDPFKDTIGNSKVNRRAA